jgi:hypothetical protein
MVGALGSPRGGWFRPGCRALTRAAGVGHDDVIAICAAAVVVAVAPRSGEG